MFDVAIQLTNCGQGASGIGCLGPRTGPVRLCRKR